MTSPKSLLLCAAILLLAGCSSSSSASPDPTDELASKVTAAKGLDPGVISYTIDIADRERGTVAIELEIPNAGPGPTVLTIPDAWGGLSDIPSLIRKVRARDGTGSTLEVRRPAPTRWRIDHPRGATLRVRYRVASTVPKDQSSPTAMIFTPEVEPGRIFMLGVITLLQPRGLSADPVQHWRLTWKNVPDDWKTATSFSTERRTDVEASFRDLQRSMFYAGNDLRILRREVERRPVLLALSGSWSFDDDRLMEVTAKIISAQRDFFDDHDAPYFIVGLLPVRLRGTPLEGQDLASGTGLHQSFVAFLVPERTSLQGSKAFKAKHLLAHELFHNWNGAKILRTPEEREASVYWFTEGFTEHFAREILLQEGLVDRKRYLRDLNRQITDYLTNPVREISNDELAERFWTSSHGRKLAYQRGAMVALMLDHAIRNHSDGETSLADLMRYLHRTEPKRSQHPNDRIFEAVARFTDDAYAETLRQLVMSGDLVELRAEFLGPCYRLQQRQTKVRQFGINVEKTLTNRRVHGVTKGSPAARAGLSNGEEIVGFQKIRDDEGVALRLEVAKDGGSVTRLVRPTVETQSVPQYRYAPENCSASAE